MCVPCHTCGLGANIASTQVSAEEQKKYANELAGAYRGYKGEVEPTSEKYYKVSSMSSTTLYLDSCHLSSGEMDASA